MYGVLIWGWTMIDLARRRRTPRRTWRAREKLRLFLDVIPMVGIIVFSV